MLKSDDRVSSFVIKHLNGEMTESDKQYLGEWLNESDKNLPFFSRYSDKQFLSAELEKIYAFDEEAGWEKFIQSHIYDPNNLPVDLTRKKRIKQLKFILGGILLAIVLFLIFR